MTRHLSPEDFVDVLDGSPTADRQAHLLECQACRVELDTLRATLENASTLPAGEPSPLFWEHFPARVKDAVSAERVPAAPWRWRWAALGAAATTLGVVAVALVLWQAPGPGRSPSLSTPVDASVDATFDEGMWDLVIDVARETDWTTVQQTVAPARGTADAMIADLTDEQREALIRLLQQEIGAS